MKRMSVMLTAAALALVPLMGNAKGHGRTPELPIDESLMSCSCSDPGAPELVDGVRAVPVTCSAEWEDVIGALTEPATYGASFDVELLDDATDGEPVDALMADLEGDWSTLCETGTCIVPDTMFYLTNYDDQEIEVSLAVKAFFNGKGGTKPRNFEKSRVPCSSSEDNTIEEPLQ